MPDESPEQAFERGVGVGRIEQRLAGHDVHLGKINGSVADVARELASLRAEQANELVALRLAVQSLSDAISTEKLVSEARREESDYAWTPLQRFTVGLVTLVVVAALAIAARGGVG
jgi:hypothetical protein